MERIDATNACAIAATKGRRKFRGRNLRWESLIGPFDAREFQVFPLTSSDELREEGELMSHCVGRRYPRWCHVGAVRVFSIRNFGDRRVATASLYFDFDAHCWRIEQCKGYGNEEIYEKYIGSRGASRGVDPDGIVLVLLELLARYQRAQEIHDDANQFL